MVSLADIKDAHERIEPYIHRTPILTSATLDQMSEATMFFKCENFQKAGAFKARGATNAILSLSDEDAKRGVATVSSGNHGAALAKAAQIRGIPVTVIMPYNSAKIKFEAVKSYGAEIITCEPDQISRESALQEYVSKTDVAVIHPYNDERIIAGQGTAGLELMEGQPELDAVISPVSGGGLLSGTALAVKGMNSNTDVFGAEPEGADDTFLSMKAGEIVPNKRVDTIADGLRSQIGILTFPIIQRMVTGIITVTDAEIIDAMELIWERMKILVEPSGAISLAAVLKEKSLFQRKKVGIILSGGNVDLFTLPF
ncbi:MAG: pyridoxal-phosphate dependent enzyme [Candidatus Marinimicrobia bacterium]|nr:pyridoxal-phosphate dependent enzyme [Candidatus Neomarinimicrobiota bacterium]MBT3618575.1 pyridoxal-phosphate dependent enzyme [Candidatus Neomarinimicrobiota bacterium]MBT3828802.1 pyridoxal-phosphate dependent enzyme [Candidatus Neomarinimicrobiota bacterium]MBT3996836.1 pyridoxal-phosphate dependent enzyme [Candidatus Neomarinimicrobiota bacterium]MBT4281013.1 pyridoxal-phosphate dependent enzyme [Candidatus Neomarinimicrobiota bacterium]